MFRRLANRCQGRVIIRGDFDVVKTGRDLPQCRFHGELFHNRLSAAVLAVSLSACGSSTNAKDTATNNQITTTGIDFTTGETKDNATVVKYSTVFASTGIQADGAEALGKLITRTSNGNMRIRCMEDKVLADSVSAMGAIATPMAYSDVYTGIQQGTIDGLDHTASSLASSRFQEICKYYSLTEHFTIPDPVFVSTRWFNRLSKDKQDAIVEAGKNLRKSGTTAFGRELRSRNCRN